MSGKGRPQPVRRRPKGDDEHEEHEGGSERWLVTYADMVTLLMVLFIVMFAMSTVDSTKYAQLKDGLANGFGRSAQILSGSSPLLDDQGPTSSGSEVMDNSLITNMPAQETKAIKDQVDKAQMQAKQRAYADAEAQVKSLLGLWKKMQQALAKKGLADDVQATVDERGLVVSLVSRHVVFRANLADLTPRGDEIIDTVAPVLRGITEPIDVDGHTNQVKVKPKYYPDDWGLSTARALSALRRLADVDKIPAKRLQASGFGHTKPLEDPSIKGSQQINKRVDIVVLSQAPAETRALYQQVQQDLQKTQNQTGVQP
ncbi:flagellar motor protein MotB [Nocardioides sp. BP30]|uniref:OmpA/MotB family protein n=1 Tax=Nocardioides sp. BP30 TaxID=3036374 RepID=UPI0024686256|nr:flagellar motor protein MotB [Nocardioides sp. BP30]WGL51963.1 flagellar motor protein MotB [Nocardioides sp. BP30]